MHPKTVATFPLTELLPGTPARMTGLPEGKVATSDKPRYISTFRKVSPAGHFWEGVCGGPFAVLRCAEGARISTPLPTWMDVGDGEEGVKDIVFSVVDDTPNLPELCHSAIAEPIDLLDFHLSQSLCIRPTELHFLLEPSHFPYTPHLFTHTHTDMVQGNPKGLQKQKGSSTRHAAKAAAAPKKGKRYIAPKKTALVKSASLHKVSKPNRRRLNSPSLIVGYQELSAKINKSIEQQVASAASSGKLTIMKNVAMEGYVSMFQSLPTSHPGLLD